MEPPLFCCCQFIDRHGRTAHLLDLSFADRYSSICCAPECLHELAADLDDRLRLPQYNGAIYLGIEGALPMILLPILGAVAARGPLHTAMLLMLLPAVLSQLHLRALRRRHRSRFFVSWCGASVVYAHAAFTLRVGEHIPFAFWLGTTLGHVAAGLCAAAAREPPPEDACSSSAGECGVASELRPCKADGELEGGSAAVPDDRPVEGDPRWDRGYCPLCRHSLRGYDHHCVWLDMCVGAHNRGLFLRGLLLLLATVAVEVVLCARRAEHVGGVQRRWSLEAALTSYGLLGAIAVASLLAHQGWLVGHDVTAHQARLLAKHGRELPPWIGVGPWLCKCCALLRGTV